MTTGISAKPFTVSIGGLDFTDVAETLTLEFPQDDRSGLWGCTGTLTIAGYPDNFSEVINPRINPSRFAIGTAILISFVFPAPDGIIVWPGKLSILEFPRAPYPGNPSMDIKIGDDFALKGKRSPEGNASNVVVGTSTSRTTVINSLLAAAGVGNLNNLIPEYPLTYPVQKQSTGSYIALAGQIAYAAGYRLWQQADGTVNAVRQTLDGLTAVKTYSVGQNEIDYFPVSNDNAPPEKLTVAGSTQEALLNSDPPTQINEVRDQEDGNKLITRNKLRLVNKAGNPSLRISESRSQEQILFEGSTGTDIRLGEEIIERKVFDSEGKLSVYTADTRTLAGVAMPDLFPEDTDELVSKDVKITYRYETNNLLSSKETETRELKGVIAFESEGTFVAKTVYKDLTLAERVIERWIQLSGGDYLYRKETINYREGERTSKAESFVIESPPETEYQEGQYRLNTKQVSGSASFKPLAGDKFRTEPSPISLPANVAISNAQCAEIAELEGRLQHGRAFGYQWSVPLTPDWFSSFSPVRRIDFNEGSLTRAFLTDGLNFSMDIRSSYIQGDGIEIGVEQSGILQPPFSPVDELINGFRLALIGRENVDPIEDTLSSGFRLAIVEIP